MNLTQKPIHTKNKKVLITSGIFLLLTAIYIALELTGAVNILNLDGRTSEQSQEISSNTDVKKDFIEKSDSNPNNGSDSVTPNLNETPSNPDNLSVAAKQETNGNITVLTKLYGYSDGNCTISAMNNAKTYTQTVEVIYQPEFSTCAGFNIPRTQLGTGIWDIQLTVTSKDTSISKNTKLEVK